MRQHHWGLGAGAACIIIVVAMAHQHFFEREVAGLKAQWAGETTARAATVNPASQSRADPSAGRTSITAEGPLLLPGASERLELSFSDDFRDPDRSLGTAGIWRPDFAADRQLIDNHTLRGNQEQEVYVAPDFAGTGDQPLGLNPFSFGPGGLTITASPTLPSNLPKLWNLPYTSGLISSVATWSQTYGFFEMRARLPKGKGVWPAFWLLPLDQSWPPELDIMEMLGDRPTRIYVTPHGMIDGKHVFTSVPVDMEDTSAGFHRYGVLWTPTTIRWFVDRGLVAQAPTPPDMHKPMYIIANLAIGGLWPGKADSTTPMPAKLDIDYIRSWKIVSPLAN